MSSKESPYSITTTRASILGTLTWQGIIQNILYSIIFMFIVFS